MESRGIEWGGKRQVCLPSATLICEPFSPSTVSIHKDVHHLFNVDDGVLLADVIDIALDPDVGLDEDLDHRDTDTDIELDGCASLEYARGRDLGQQRDVDGGTDVSQRSSRGVVLATGDNRVVLTGPGN